MKHFRPLKESLKGLDPEAIGSLLSTSSDIALVLDLDGVIYDLAFGNEEWLAEWYSKWLGEAWIDTVTIESRPKIESLLAEARAGNQPRWRQVNHPSSWGADVPVTYTAMQIGETGAIVACGRELWSTSLLQQRLVNAQQSMERQYAKLRHTETRYRLLFQTTNEAVLILDGNSARIVEINPAAEQLLGRAADQLRDSNFLDALDERGRGDVLAFLNSLRAGGRDEDIQVKLVPGETAVMLSGSFFRQDNTTLLLLRLKPTASPVAVSATPTPATNLLQVIEQLPDALVVTDRTSAILACNPAFLELAQLASSVQVIGAPLERWLGRPGVDLNVLVVNLRQHGAVRLYPTVVRSDFGGTANVEVSAVAVDQGNGTHFGYMIRNVDQRPRGEGPTVGQGLPRSVHQLTELVGRVPLKELVRETVDEIERLCIEAALELTGDNRASAAELLGLSRQSLYVKLRRYGIAEPTNGSETSR